MAEVFSILSIERRAATTAIRYPELSQNLKNHVTVKNTSLARDSSFGCGRHHRSSPPHRLLLYRRTRDSPCLPRMITHPNPFLQRTSRCLSYRCHVPIGKHHARANFRSAGFRGNNSEFSAQGANSFSHSNQSNSTS
jgi:hypothetical protein